MQGKIAEIFESIQGEGVYQGVRQIFVRFVGCIQRCNFCICDNANVMLSNRIKKKLKDLRKFDELMAFDEINKISTNTVIDKIFRGETEEIFELELADGIKLKITGEHRVFTQSGWVRVKDLHSTDEVLTLES